jgi:hypothetical protein
MTKRPLACIVGLWILAGVCLVLAAAPADACQTPVFRYALERWRSDPYHVLIVHRGAMTDDQRGLIARLDKAVEDPARLVNLVIDVVDLDDNPSAPAAKLAQTYSDKPLPTMIVRYPLSARVPFDVAWAQPFTDANVTALIDSPARREIAKHILGGDSAVWLLVECGDKDKDAAAAAVLETELKKMQEQIQLPPVDPNTFNEDFRDNVKVKLRVGFSVIRLKKDDPAESFLISALLGSEKDLTGLIKTDPMAFPVFGRGRVLWALVGKGINGDNVFDSCSFLSGACSCQVKEQNPGVDLVMAVPWEDSIVGRAVVDKPLPELTGLSALEPAAKPEGADATDAPSQSPAEAALAQATTTNPIAPAAAAPAPQPAVADVAEPVTPTAAVAEQNGPSALTRNVLIVLGAGLLVIITATAAMKRKPAA